MSLCLCSSEPSRVPASLCSCWAGWAGRGNSRSVKRNLSPVCKYWTNRRHMITTQTVQKLENRLQKNKSSCDFVSSSSDWVLLVRCGVTSVDLLMLCQDRWAENTLASVPSVMNSAVSWQKCDDVVTIVTWSAHINGTSGDMWTG